MSVEEWIERTSRGIAMSTKLPVKLRNKPRKNGTSGPSVASVPIEKELEGAAALVTSGSLTAIDALLEGVPVFTTSPNNCPAAWCAETDFKKINNPTQFDREDLFFNLAYKQFSIPEFRSGKAYEIITKYIYR